MLGDAASQSSRLAIERERKWGTDHDAPLDVVIHRGAGASVWDVDGRRYHDFLSAYSAVSQGHCHPRIVRALTQQAATLTISSRAFRNDRLPAMLECLGELTGFEKVLPMNTGAEAVETALKAMRRWGYEVKGVPDGSAEILVMSGNFHGRTTTIVGFSDEPAHSHHFGPPTPGFRVVPFGDAAALEAALSPNTVGVLVEPIQGEAGVRIPPDGYLREARRLCTEAAVLLCCDEVQTGLGRTGRMFAFEHEGIRPDVLILGKSISGGVYPVSCVCANGDVMRVFRPGSHGSTYGGNPLAAAVVVEAVAVVRDEDLCGRSRELGLRALERLRRELQTPLVREVRGRGLMMAVELHQPVALRMAHRLAERGLLVKDTHDHVLRLMPPLVIPEPDLDAALTTFIEVVREGVSPQAAP